MIEASKILARYTTRKFRHSGEVFATGVVTGTAGLLVGGGMASNIASTAANAGLGIIKASEAVDYFGRHFGEVVSSVSSRGMGSSQMMEKRLENSFTNLGADIMRALNDNGFVVGEDIKYAECNKIPSFDLGAFNPKRAGIENICLEVAGFMQAFEQEKAHFGLRLKDNVARQVDGIIKHEVIPVFSGLIASTAVDITEIDKKAANAVLGAGSFIKNKLFPGHDARIAEQQTNHYTVVQEDGAQVKRPKTAPAKAKTTAKSTGYSPKDGPTKENIAAYLENNPDKVEKRFGIAKDELNDGIIDKLADYVASKWQELKENAAASKHKKVEIAVFPDEWVDAGARLLEKMAETVYGNTNEDQQAVIEKTAEIVLDFVLSGVDVKALSNSLQFAGRAPHIKDLSHKKPETLGSQSDNPPRHRYNDPGDAGNSKVLAFAKDLPTEVPADRIDYTRKFLHDLKNFEQGSSKLFNGKLKEDLYLVNFHDIDVPLGGGRSIKWATHVEVGKRIPTLEELHQHLALVKPDWGTRTAVTYIKIPKGTDVTMISGKAKWQWSPETQEYFRGGAYQTRFYNFDAKWITETKPINDIIGKK